MRLFLREMTTMRAYAAALSLVIGQIAAAAEEVQFNLGRSVSELELSSWNIDVATDGAGLPAGRGSVHEGKAIYAAKCAACHGPEGQGQPMDRLAGGRGTLQSDEPMKTIGSFWPYATTLFDYVRRAMPLDRPQSLSANEVYALTAYLLHLNGIVGADAIMAAKSLPKVRMPNRTAFRPDPRPDVSNSDCQTDCQ